MLFIAWASSVSSLTFQFKIILYQYSILNGSDPGGTFQCAIVVESRGCPDEIIALPFSRFCAGIGQGNGLFINAACLPVDICFVVVAIEYLYLITIIAPAGRSKEYTTVSATLVGACNIFRNAPFDM